MTTVYERSVLEVRLSAKDKYYKYLKLINGILGLSPVQLSALAYFLDYGKGGIVCSSEHRKAIKEILQIKNINVYVKIFKDKKLIIQEGKQYKAAQIILPPEQGVNIDIKWA